MNTFQYQMVCDSLAPEQWRVMEKNRRTDIMNRVFYEDAFRDWFYHTDRNTCEIPVDNEHVNTLFTLLAQPQAMQTLIEYIESSNREDFDRTSCCIAWLVAEKAIERSNAANRKIDDDYKNGAISKETAADYRRRAEMLEKIISDLIDRIRKKIQYTVDEIARKTNLPQQLIYSTIFIVPGREYIPKNRIGFYVQRILQEIYHWTGQNGLDDARIIHWGPYFGNFFGNNLTSSAAVSILLEGVNRIEAYQQLDHFDDVSAIWDTLTDFALKELNRASDDVRTQMVELYMKRLRNINRSTNGNMPQLRVDLLRIPRDLTNLMSTVQKFGQQIKSLTNSEAPLIDSSPVTNNAFQNRPERRIDDRARRERHITEFDHTGYTGDPNFDAELQRARRIDGKRMYENAGSVFSDPDYDQDEDSSWVTDDTLYPPDEDEEDDTPKPLFGV